MEQGQREALSPGSLSWKKASHSPWGSGHLQCLWRDQILSMPQTKALEWTVETWGQWGLDSVGDPSNTVPGSREQMPRWEMWAAPKGCERAHLQQREVGQKAGVQLFHIVEKFNQVDVSLAQLAAHKIVLSMALQHLANGGVRSGTQAGAGWAQCSSSFSPAPFPPLRLTGRVWTFRPSAAPGSVRRARWVPPLCGCLTCFQHMHRVSVDLTP